LPILSHIDGLTTNEIKLARDVVKRDLAKVFNKNEGAGFGIFGPTEDDGLRVSHCSVIPYSVRADHQPSTTDFASSSESENDQPLTPVSLTDDEPRGLEMPYTSFSPELSSTLTNGLTREYPWGSADVQDPRQSDFMALRSAIIGEYAGVSDTWAVAITVLIRRLYDFKQRRNFTRPTGLRGYSRKGEASKQNCAVYSCRFAIPSLAF
jgi:hypothetical protein